MVRNFRYVEPGAVALSGVPETPEAVDWLHDQGIRLVVSLHPLPPEVQHRLQERGIAWHPVLVSDFAAGVPAGFRPALEAAAVAAAQHTPVLIH